MKLRTGIAAALFFLPPAMAMAQGEAGSEIKLPEACQKAIQASGNMSGMPQMDAMTKDMQQRMGGEMGEATKDYMQVMAAMQQPMMQGAMAQNADVAFNCAMIVHHLGAVAMARIELEYGKDEASRKMAQSTIDAQSKEAEQMTKWVEEHAKKQSQ